MLYYTVAFFNGWSLVIVFLHETNQQGKDDTKFLYRSKSKIKDL